MQRWTKHGRRALGAAVLAALCAAGTAHGAAPKSTAATRATCESPNVLQPFAAFKDDRDYVLAPGGDFEDPALPGWELAGGAHVTPHGESGLGGLASGNSLVLPVGASATTPYMCVDLNWPSMRFAAAQVQDKEGQLAVEVLYPESQDDPARWHKSRDFKYTLQQGWRLTDDVKLDPQRGGKFAGGRPVALRFTNPDDRGTWRVDDVYVDPRMRN